MPTVLHSRAFQEAVAKQHRAQIDFDTAEPTHRAKQKSVLLDATRAVIAAAARIKNDLEDAPAQRSKGAGASLRRAPAGPARATTIAEERLLRSMLADDLLPRPQRRDPRATAETRPPLLRAPDGSFAARPQGPTHASHGRHAAQADDEADE